MGASGRSAQSQLRNLSMRAEQKSATTSDYQKSFIGDLINWNGLAYAFPVNNSVAASRQRKREEADLVEYKEGQTLKFTLQTGVEFVDWRKSSLCFSLTLSCKDADGASVFANYPGDQTGFDADDLKDGTWPAATFGNGSVLNLFESMVVTTRGGTEIQRLDNFAHYACVRDHLKHDADWFDAVGSEMCYASKGDITDSVDAKADGGYSERYYRKQSGLSGKRKTKSFHTEMKFGDTDPVESHVDICIPMYALGGFFEPSQLCPAQLCAGLRIELKIRADLRDAFIVTGNTYKSATTASPPAPTLFADDVKSMSVKLTDAHMWLDTTLLNDAAIRSLNATAAQNGLEWTFANTFTQRQSIDSGRTNVQCQKAVSRALEAIVIRCPEFTQDVTLDCFDFGEQSRGIKLGANAGFDFRLGAMRYPNRPILNNSQNQANNRYIFGEHLSNTGLEFVDHMQIFAATFERSELLRYTGSAINNSRTLVFDGTVDFSSDGKSVILMLDYVALAKAYLNNVILNV